MGAPPPSTGWLELPPPPSPSPIDVEELSRAFPPQGGWGVRPASGGRGRRRQQASPAPAAPRPSTLSPWESPAANHSPTASAPSSSASVGTAGIAAAVASPRAAAGLSGGLQLGSSPPSPSVAGSSGASDSRGRLPRGAAAHAAASAGLSISPWIGGGIGGGNAKPSRLGELLRSAAAAAAGKGGYSADVSTMRNRLGASPPSSPTAASSTTAERGSSARSLRVRPIAKAADALRRRGSGGSVPRPAAAAAAVAAAAAAAEGAKERVPSPAGGGRWTSSLTAADVAAATAAASVKERGPSATGGGRWASSLTATDVATTATTMGRTSGVVVPLPQLPPPSPPPSPPSSSLLTRLDTLVVDDTPYRQGSGSSGRLAAARHRTGGHLYPGGRDNSRSAAGAVDTSMLTRLDTLFDDMPHRRRSGGGRSGSPPTSPVGDYPIDNTPYRRRSGGVLGASRPTSRHGSHPVDDTPHRRRSGGGRGGNRPTSPRGIHAVGGGADGDGGGGSVRPRRDAAASTAATTASAASAATVVSAAVVAAAVAPGGRSAAPRQLPSGVVEMGKRPSMENWATDCRVPRGVGLKPVNRQPGRGAGGAAAADEPPPAAWEDSDDDWYDAVDWTKAGAAEDAPVGGANPAESAATKAAKTVAVEADEIPWAPTVEALVWTGGRHPRRGRPRRRDGASERAGGAVQSVGVPPPPSPSAADDVGTTAVESAIGCTGEHAASPPTSPPPPREEDARRRRLAAGPSRRDNDAHQQATQGPDAPGQANTSTTGRGEEAVLCKAAPPSPPPLPPPPPAIEAIDDVCGGGQSSRLISLTAFWEARSSGRGVSPTRVMRDVSTRSSSTVSGGGRSRAGSSGLSDVVTARWGGAQLRRGG